MVVVLVLVVVLAAVLAEGGWSMKQVLVVLKVGLPLFAGGAEGRTAIVCWCWWWRCWLLLLGW